MKINTVITLDDNTNCLLLEDITHENKKYFLATILNEKNEPSKDSAIFEEIIDGQDIYDEKVENEELLGTLLRLFTEKTMEKVKDLPKF